MSVRTSSASSRSPLVASRERGLERSAIVQQIDLGVAPYESAASWQQHRAQAVAAGTAPEIVAFMQHNAVYTQGRRGGRDHVVSMLAAPIIDTDRGGDITFHGPGQIVIWPILRLRARGIGIVSYVRALEAVAIEVAREFGVEATRIPGRPGVWVGNRKLASVGIRVQSGISRHGLALNCDVDLSWFDSIRACGIADAEVTSLWRERGERINVGACTGPAVQAFEEVFQVRLSRVRAAVTAS